MDNLPRSKVTRTVAQEMRRFWLPSVLFFLLSISLQQLVCAVEREINVDGTPASSASATKKINKVIDVEAIERAWHKGDDPAELEAEQTFIRKIRQGKLDEEKKRVPKKGAANINSKSRIAQIDKDTQFDVQIFVELKKPINDGVEVDWTENDVNLLGVKWRQRLISSSLSVGFAAVPVFKKLVKKVKGKKKKRQVNNILLVFTVERGYQTVEVMKFLLKQKQTNKVSLDEIQYTIDDLPSEDRQLDSIDDRGDNDEDESEVDNAPAEPRRKKRKVSDTNPSSEGDVDPKGIHGLGGPVRKEPKTYDPLNVNRYGDEAAFGVHLYAELFQEKKKGSGLGWTLGDGDEVSAVSAS